MYVDIQLNEGIFIILVFLNLYLHKVVILFNKCFIILRYKCLSSLFYTFIHMYTLA